MQDKFTCYYLCNTIERTMTMKRTSLHLDDRDLKALERLAKIETQRTGSRVSASQIVRRLIREFLHNQPSFSFARITHSTNA